jgi:hypothetical protein
MSRLLLAASFCCAVAVATGCNTPPLVVQGTVSAYDPQANTVTVRDELAPNAELTLSLAGTEIGSAPNPGDVVRVAYRELGGRATAIRLMNLTRQDEIAKLHDKKH